MWCNCARVGRNCRNMGELFRIGFVFACRLPVLCCVYVGSFVWSWIIFGCCTLGDGTVVLEECVALGAGTSIVGDDGVGTMGGDSIFSVRLVVFFYSYL